MRERLHERDEAQHLTPWCQEQHAVPPQKADAGFRTSVSMSAVDRPKDERLPDTANEALAPLFAGRLLTPHYSAAQKLSRKGSRFIARNLRTKSVSMCNSAPLVTFTFDDVPVSAAEVGAAILEREGVLATFYIAGAGCGAMSPNGRLAAVHELRGLARRGHEIGCHTFTHPAVSTIDTCALAAEIERNGGFLKANIGVAPVNFAFPYGDISFRTKRYLETRFDSCRCNLRGVNTTTLDLGALRSYELDNASINRAQIVSLIYETVKSNGWLIFCGHAVERNASRFSVTPELLAFTVAAAKAEGCQPVTIATGLKIVRASEKARGPIDRAIDGAGDPS